MRNRPRSWQHLSVSAAALLLVVIGILAVAAPASASTVQVASGTINLVAVACPSATTCEAVGYNVPTPTTAYDLVVTITNGVPSTPQAVSGPGPELLGLDAVACPRATTCVAVGTEYFSEQLVGGVVVTITNGIPGTPQVVPGGSGLDAVACPSATTCEALGVNGSYQEVVVPITNGTPGTPQAVPGAELLYAVACPSATTCEAVGHSTSGQGVVVPITNGTLGTPQVVPGTSGLGAVACPSATTCEALGGSTSGQGVVVTITNGTPGTPQAVPEPGETLESFGPTLDGVACPSVTTCVAVGTNFCLRICPQPEGGGVVVPITNGIPGPVLEVSGEACSPDYCVPPKSLEGVACSSAATCVAVGWDYVFQGVVAVVLNAS